MIKIYQKCWQVTESYDRDSTVVAYAATMAVANQIKQSNNDAYRLVSEKVFNILIVESMEELTLLKHEALIASAKAKLTSAERKALGLE